MSGEITWEQIISLIVIAGAVGGVWYRLQNQISLNRAYHEAELAKHRLHIAESYITKAGMTEQTDRMMKAIEGLGMKIDRTNERIDQAFVPIKPSRPSRQ